MKGKIIAIIIILLIIGVFAYTQGYFGKLSVPVPFVNTTDSIEPFLKLRDKYAVKENYSTKPVVINDYLNELSALRLKSFGSSAKIIDSEIYLAQSFYNLSLALDYSQSIDYYSINCNEPEVKQAKDNARISMEFTAKAINSISQLNESELKTLGANSREKAKEYSAIANTIKQQLDTLCPNV